MTPRKETRYLPFTGEPIEIEVTWCTTCGREECDGCVAEPRPSLPWTRRLSQSMTDDMETAYIGAYLALRQDGTRAADHTTVAAPVPSRPAEREAPPTGIHCGARSTSSRGARGGDRSWVFGIALGLTTLFAAYSVARVIGNFGRGSHGR